MKFIQNAKDIPSRNPVAQALRHGLFRKKVVRDKKQYTRKGRLRENRRNERFSTLFSLRINSLVD